MRQELRDWANGSHINHAKEYEALSETDLNDIRSEFTIETKVAQYAESELTRRLNRRTFRMTVAILILTALGVLIASLAFFRASP